LHECAQKPVAGAEKGLKRLSAGKNLCPKRREIHQVKKRMQQAQMVLSYAGFPFVVFSTVGTRIHGKFQEVYV
jgi:hypothetical protein